MTPLLEVTGLCKKLGDFSLKDISFSLEPGYIMGIIGVNGSGKTTLMRTVLNLYQPDAGCVKVMGMSMDQEEAASKAHIGTVLDEDFFNENFSPEKNGEMFGRLYETFDMGVFHQVCKRFEIPFDQKISNLSKGTRKRLQFAFAIAHDADLYFMDEPADGLDPYFRRSLLSCMQEIVESGKRSVVFSTHLTEDLDKVADYILMLQNGRLRFCLDKESLCSRFRLIQDTRKNLEQLPREWIAGLMHGEFHSEALLILTEENKALYARSPIPRLSAVLYHLERGMPK